MDNPEKIEHSISSRPTHLFGSVLNLRWTFTSYAILLFLKLSSNTNNTDERIRSFNYKQTTINGNPGLFLNTGNI